MLVSHVQLTEALQSIYTGNLPAVRQVLGSLFLLRKFLKSLIASMLYPQSKFMHR